MRIGNIGSVIKVTEQTRTFEVSVTGVEKAVEQFESLLRDVQSEGERGGVDISIKELEEPPEHTGGFDG